jgi:hypothetical protein
VTASTALANGTTATTQSARDNTTKVATTAYVDAEATLTTKGDVQGYSSVPARIPVGADGTVLTADSTQTLGVKWATAPSGIWTLISDQLLGSPAASVTFSSVSGYKHLIMMVVGRNSLANNDDGVICFVNGDTNTANYNRTYLGNNGTTVFAGSAPNGPYICQLPGTNTTSLAATAATITFQNYGGTTFWKNAVCDSGYRSSTFFQNFSNTWEWENTAAITSMVLSMQSGGNFVTGSRFTLYGIS